MIRALVLGLVQGLTEFLPVSSSGHLVLAEHILRVPSSGVLLEVLLHLATLVAVVALFWRDLVRLARSLFTRSDKEGRREVLLLVVGTLPIVFFGFFFQKTVTAAFTSLTLVGIFLLITGAILLAASRAASTAQRSRLRLVDSVTIGLAQAVALLPGISRSGSTLCAGILSGVEARQAARFSFLLSIPAILGAGVLKLPEALRTTAVSRDEWLWYFAAMLVAGLVAALAIRGLLAALVRGRLKRFGVYCLAIGLFTLAFARFA